MRQVEGTVRRGTREKFWLDGGYDRDQVEACRHHPDHDWITLTVTSDNPQIPDEPMTVCSACGVPRCGESDPGGCDLPRHHQPEDHVTPSGLWWPIGGTDPRVEAA